MPPDSADPVADLRSAITAALDALQVDPAGVKAHEALTATYISASRTHKAAARRLGVPYGTYRRHLAMAKERLVEQLLRQPAPTPPRSSPERWGREGFADRGHDLLGEERVLPLVVVERPQDEAVHPH